LGKIVTQLLMVLMYVVSRKGKIRNWTFKIYSIEYNERKVKLACLTTIVMALLTNGGMSYCNVEAK
jgi:hypothetical protein